ncbi:putative tRNA-splicing endonuclease subunit sen15 [Schizosaccharomyces pombe]|uniref:Probable tRNA-splicing endonuclease subunit sen15 n=1 Tax=Schizosaccharomyces pombe (strain 972 / ATCC 24843) TaxID=284812 RepID=SEN15_SCHPO|nr:putative tRNA-splicing endonuclease subunit Sen15 [Schizosaccharomyces pombe]Q7LKV3.1 RecName: Full=Probable tRNA-splicing endonuclease subunit sen15; AltName: Full=tRNA-intron endonuclease sen15 [Schizosaccharomyces pombe 972h-]CAE46913.1 tRNA-splicing endonuclease subunit Sen15 (predicted) [Schizosaccharomyces pombe]|eukprot:NP_001018260.1 putative tRNA-splicing endonuclease subunit Sen15 [Schizosaccharomyces pombe]
MQHNTFLPNDAVEEQKQNPYYGILRAVETDLRLGQRWCELKVHVLDIDLKTKRPLLSGIPVNGQLKDKLQYVLPLYLQETISIEFLSSVFDSMKKLSLPLVKDARGLSGDEFFLYLGIMCSDSTIVYYKITDGLIKPRQNDEE